MIFLSKLFLISTIHFFQALKFDLALVFFELNHYLDLILILKFQQRFLTMVKIYSAALLLVEFAICCTCGIFCKSIS